MDKKPANRRRTKRVIGISHDHESPPHPLRRCRQHHPAVRSAQPKVRSRSGHLRLRPEAQERDRVR